MLKSSSRATGSRTGNIKSERIYFKIEDLNLKKIEKSDTQKGYEYGSSVIPIPKELESLLKFQDERCLKLLGFVEKDKIPRHMGMKNVDVMLPVLDDLNHFKAFSALAKNLISSNKMALARMVIRNNSGPKLMVLVPKVIKASEGKYCFYISQLPTNEDLRQFRFSSLRSSTAPQRNIVRKLISKMNISNEENGLNLNQIIMPQTQLLNHRIMRESVSASEPPVPDPNSKGKYQDGPVRWDKELSRQLQIEETMREGLEDLDSEIRETFDLTENQEMMEKSKKKYWGDVLRENEKIQEEEQMIQKMKDHKRDTVPDEISRNYAISDFNAMMTFRGKDLVDKAVMQMKSIILDIVKGSLSGSHFAKALECIKALRRGCITEDEPKAFNTFMNQIKKISQKEKSFFSFFRSLKENGINLISDQEVSENGESMENVQTFFEDEENEEELEQKQEQNDEDLLRMMDELE